MGGQGRRAWSRAIAPADQTSVRRNNLSVVLRHLRDHGPRSRASIALETGLNKATVSSLVAELIARGLVREVGTGNAGSVGRPAQLLELDGSTVGAVGLEVNVDYLAALATDLAGRELYCRHVPFSAATAGFEATLTALAATAQDAIAAVQAKGATPAGLTVAVPGLVDVGRGVVTLAPNLKWRNAPLVDRLRGQLGQPAFPVRVDNDANLSALAEYWYGADAGTPYLLYLTGEVGVGGGVIAGGQLLRGADGYSGEVGHMQLDAGGPRCGCGRRGCWEALVGLAALLRAASPGTGAPGTRASAADIEDRLNEIVEKAEAGESRTLEALEEIGRWLGIGASILVNLFNPRVVVLGGYFARVGPWIVDAAMAQLRDRVVAPDAGGCRISLSTLGFTAAVRGGAGVAIEAVLADPTTVGGGTGPGRPPAGLRGARAR